MTHSGSFLPSAVDRALKPPKRTYSSRLSGSTMPLLRMAMRVWWLKKWTSP